MLHNLCRYILYVCRYIAKYISMANESNLKKWKEEKYRASGRRGELAVSYLRYLARIIPVYSEKSKDEE